MVRFFAITLFTLSVFLLGCSRIYGPVAELNDFVVVKKAILDEGFKKISASPNSQGVDDAQKIFEAKKGELAAKKEALDKAPRGLNGDWLTKKYESEKYDSDTFDSMKKLVASDPTAIQKLAAYEKAFDAATR